MLSDSKLGKCFWAEALSTAVYIKNRTPTSSLRRKITPYEAYYSKKPDISHLKIFGSVAFAHIPKDERAKLDNKSRKSLFLGYSDDVKGYKLYDIAAQKVFISRDVVFDEIMSNPNNSSKECEQPVAIMNSDSEISSEEDNTEENDLTLPRRSQRVRFPPDRFGEWVNAVNETCPSSANEAFEDNKWKNAMKSEMDSMKENKVWNLVDQPINRKIVKSKWVFKVKNNNGSPHYKARLVACGYTQKFGEDYDTVFSPVVRFESVRTLIAFAVQKNLKLYQMDVTCAFLNGDLAEEIYLQQPECFVVAGEEHKVCKLNKSIYGLKQSARCWNICIDEQLHKMGFKTSSSDPCIYISDQNIYVALYVDDLIICGESEDKLRWVKKELTDRFKLKDLGELQNFLGVQITQKMGEIFLSQSYYIEKMLVKFNMDQCKPIDTPADSNSHLTASENDNDLVDSHLYQSAVGCLLYLATKTRPDISFAVSQVAKFCSKPNKQHWTAVKRVFRYLKGSVYYGIRYLKSASDVVGYSDSDWAGDAADRKSVSGYCFMFQGGCVSWKSKKQSTVALSTAEAEYNALNSAAQEAIWLQQLMRDITGIPSEPIVIYEDNQAAIAMSKDVRFHSRCKHLSIKTHFIRDHVRKGDINVVYCPTSNMIADFLTKALARDKFKELRTLSGIVSCEV